MRIDARDDLAVEIEHQAQHAVRGRMLRPEIDRDLRIFVRQRACRVTASSSFAGRRRRHRGLLVAGQDVRRAFPWAHEIEVAEFLDQLHRLIDDALQLVVVAHLDIAGQREILAQRIAGEAVVGEDAAQVGMIGERRCRTCRRFRARTSWRRDRRRRRTARRRPRRPASLTRMRMVLGQRQQVIDDVEALRRAPASRRRRCRSRIVNSQSASSRRKVSTRTISAGATSSVSSPSASGCARDRAGQRALRSSGRGRSRSVHAQRSIVPVRRIFRCSSMMP